jgi:pimeloyl-ACP methyl ester carboxylesterase
VTRHYPDHIDTVHLHAREASAAGRLRSSRHSGSNPIGRSLKKATVPVLVMHGDDDQIAPYANSAPLFAKLLRNSALKTYEGFPHGMPTTEADTIKADLLTFLKGASTTAAA